MRFIYTFMIPVIHKYPTSESAAAAVAELILENANIKKNSNEYYNIAVSGGKTPKYLFSILAEIPDFRLEIPWENVRFFWVDERCVEPTDIESNYGMTYDALLQYAFVPSQNVFRMRGEDIPTNEAERYRGVLLKELPARNGMPVFDLVLLGIGEDGHAASIFPDQMHLLDSENTVEVATHPQSGQKRITITGNVVHEAEKVLFLITGSSKAEIVSSIINKEPGSESYPASHMHDSKGQAHFFLDEQAIK